MTHTALLAQHDLRHAHWIATFQRLEYGVVTVGTFQYLGVLFMGERDIGHAAFDFHDNKQLQG